MMALILPNCIDHTREFRSMVKQAKNQKASPHKQAYVGRQDYKFSFLSTAETKARIEEQR